MPGRPTEAPPVSNRQSSGGRGICGQHDCPMGTLRGHLEEVGDELRVFAQIDSTEPRNSAPTVAVYKEQRHARPHGPLQRLADGLRPHHRSDGAVRQVVPIFHRPVLMGENHYVPGGGGQTRRDEPHAFVRECMWRPKSARMRLRSAAVALMIIFI